MADTVLSAGVIILRDLDDIPHFLLLRAYDYWDFPKGLVEPDEAPLAAAIREVEEETTLTGLEFPWGEVFQETPPYGRGKIARYYVARSASGEVDLPISEELGHPEHDEWRWLVFDDAIDLLNERVGPILRWAHALARRDST